MWLLPNNGPLRLLRQPGALQLPAALDQAVEPREARTKPEGGRRTEPQHTGDI